MRGRYLKEIREKVELTSDHVAHQVMRITTYAEELQTCVSDEGIKRSMSCNSDTMPVFNKEFSQSYVGLNVTYLAISLEPNVNK
jgi:hypothetical protein